MKLNSLHVVLHTYLVLKMSSLGELRNTAATTFEMFYSIQFTIDHGSTTFMVFVCRNIGQVINLILKTVWVTACHLFSNLLLQSLSVCLAERCCMDGRCFFAGLQTVCEPSAIQFSIEIGMIINYRKNSKCYSRHHN